jgi:hypothetical protein
MHKLRLLNGSHSAIGYPGLDNLDTDLLKLWAAVGELVLDNPLHEGLCDNGPASHLKHQPRTKKN